MLKASALYMVIVIALVMAITCSSLIVAAYFYKMQYQKSFRMGQLQLNAASGINILLGSKIDFSSKHKVSLFGQPNDTVVLERSPWGLYDVGTAQAFIQKDTLSRTCSIGNSIDSTQWSALYIIDEDRNISVSGKTSIQGVVYIPKAGIKEAYVNNQAYQGDKRLVIGDKRKSDRTLPVLNNTVLLRLQKMSQKADRSNDSLLILQDSVKQSFLKPALYFDLGKNAFTLSNNLEGHIFIRSDTTITISSTARLQNILVLAPAIKVESGFHGSCQLFATDSILVEANCRLDYPSVLGVLNFGEKAIGQRKLSISSGSSVTGVIFTYEKAKNELMPVLDLGKEVVLTGQVYAQGLFNYQDGTVIHGSVYTTRFLYQTSYTRYENYLINFTLNGPSLSSYYLTSGLLPADGKIKKVLQWLD
jgi:hypothetical protein